MCVYVFYNPSFVGSKIAKLFQGQLPNATVTNPYQTFSVLYCMLKSFKPERREDVTNEQTIYFVPCFYVILAVRISPFEKRKFCKYSHPCLCVCTTVTMTYLDENKCKLSSEISTNVT